MPIAASWQRCLLVTDGDTNISGRDPAFVSYPKASILSPSVLHKGLVNEVDNLKKIFRERYAEEPRVFRAPGRVNLIGEHTDYSDGFVMPAAIGFYAWIAVSPRRDRKLKMYSVEFDEYREIGLDEPPEGPKGHWSDYVRGIAFVLDQSGICLPGANIALHGDVPQGAGLSSSASIEVATGYALLTSGAHVVDRIQLAKACQQAEHRFVGTLSGIMDQFISCNGRKGKALMLDCRSLDYQLVPVPSEVNMIVCNTMVKHELATGEYNLRRSECEEGARFFAKILPQRKISALRDVTLQDLETYGGDLPTVIYRRCRHVISENGRVLRAVKMLQSGDLPGFGKLMAESHRSLREDFEVSCKELDIMVEIAASDAIGARMTGGGFGGCTINLVWSERSEEFKDRVSRAYEKAIGIKPEIYVCYAAEGAYEVTHESAATR